MRKPLSVLLSILLIFALTACGSAKSEGEDSTEEKSAAPIFEESGKPTGTKTLVVYYSATGRTKNAAEYIAAETGGDLFELVPVEPYTSADLDWTDADSRVSYEHNHPDDREVELVSSTVDNFDEYDVVFIGYPVWWGIAAWPVDGFIKANDFTGKTVVPFCTSASSGLGNSGNLLKEAAGSGDWAEGKRFASGVSRQEVKEWVKELGY